MKGLDSFLTTHYSFRYNQITEQCEFHDKHKFDKYRVVDEREFNTLVINAIEEGVNCMDRDMRRYLGSSRIPSFHPVTAPSLPPALAAGHLSEVRGAKITAFSVPTNFSLRNLSPARRVITAEGTAARRTAARKPAELPCSRCRGGIVARRTAAGGTARPQVLRPEEHRTSAADRRNCQPVEVARYRVSPSKLPAIASARRGGTLSQRPVASARYRSRPSNRWLKSSCGAGM